MWAMVKNDRNNINYIIIMQINELLKYTLDSGASDLHLSVGSIPSIRLNGEIKNLKLPIMDSPTMEGISKEILDKH